MEGLLLLITVTVLYAGYNLFIKASGAHVPEMATTTIAALLTVFGNLLADVTYAAVDPRVSYDAPRRR